jgi:putative transcriptional regulator
MAGSEMATKVKNRLREILDNRGIKTAWLAEQVGVSYKTLSNILVNKYNTSLYVALKIADVLNVKIDEIFYLEK